MRRAVKRPVQLLHCLLLCACASSPPVQFYVLDSIAPASGTGRAAGRPVQIAAVHMPGTLDRREMVREEAPNQLTISDQNRWGAPLAGMTRRILSQNLTSRLAPGRVASPEQPPPAGTGSVSVDILQFGPVASGVVVLEGTWSLVPSGADAATASHPLQLSRPAVRGDYAEQAHLMSILLGEAADAMALELSAPR